MNTELDPVFAAIAAADEAQRLHLVALDGLDEDDDAQMRRANAAADAETAAFERLTKVMPTTLAGLRALADRYAVEAEETERWSAGGSYLRHIARVCIGIAQDGHPLHPLMPSYDRPFIPGGGATCWKELSGQNKFLSISEGAERERQ